MNLFQEAKQILDKDGKVNPLGPYGKSKLTGQEVASYFRKNKVSDPQVKKAVEVALDLGGAYDIARKEIAKFFGDKILKSKEVQYALKFANEEVVAEGKLDEKKNYKYSKNFFSNDRNDKLKNISDRDGYGEIELGHYLAQKAGLKNPDNLYFDDDELVYGSKTIVRGAYDKSVSQLLDVVKKIKEEVVTEGKIHDSIIRRDFPNVWAASAKDKEILKKFHAKVDTNNYKQMKDAYKKDMKKFVDDLKTVKLSDLLKSMQVKGGKWDGWMTDEVQKEEVIAEGTMGIGIFDRDPKKADKAIKGMEKLIGSIRGSTKVGSPEGKKFSKELDMKYLSDDELADDFANPKNKDKSIKDILKKHQKRLGIKFEEVEMDKKESVSEGILFREYEPGEYINGEEKRFVDLIKKNGGKNISVVKPTRREPNLHIEFEGGNILKMQKDLDRIDDGLTNLEEAVSPAQQAAIAIAKKEKEKKETVMDSYRRMWEEGYLQEEVANITVDPRNRISKPADQNKHSNEIVKQARRFGLKASQMGKHVRIKGAKKAVNDFLRIIIGKSSYGDPTEKDMSTPQIDKMLTKDLK